jgi:hypothetical protein
MNEQSRLWIPLGDKEYRTWTLYTMQWSDRKLSEDMMAIANYGGPLAVLPWNADTQNYTPQLHIYTLSGNLLSTIDVRSCDRTVCNINRMAY